MESPPVTEPTENFRFLLSFDWKVKPRSHVYNAPNIDYKDPDITEEET